MKKNIVAMFVLITLFAVCQGEAATVYNFEVNSITAGVIVSGMDLTISGNWTFGTLAPYYNGTNPWDVFVGGSGFLNLGDSTSDASVPLVPGLVFTLISNNDGPLAITFMDPYDSNGFSVQEGAVSANLNVVPIPAAVWLLGSGVVGLVALKRRKKA